MSFNDFIKNDNKSIIWGLLQEGGVFNDIPNNMFDNVKRLFESSILSMKPEFDIFFDKNDEGDDDYDKKASDMIINSNKTVIKKMIEEIKKFKHPNVKQNSNVKMPTQQQQSQMLHVPPRFDMNPTRDTNKIGGGSGGGGSGSSKKPKIEEIYRADDLQKNRMSELELRLKEKQQEMDLMLNNKKPESIDFSDSKLNDNKLASDEMERLLAEALSSRNRELEIISMNTNDVSSKVAEEWITGSTDPVAKAVNASINIKRSNDIKRPIEKINTVPASTSKKNVSFNENNNEQISIPYEKDTNDHENNNLSFLSKLKVKNAATDSPTHTISLDDYNAESNDDNNYHNVGNVGNVGNEYDNNVADDHTGMHMYTFENPRGATGAGDYEKLYTTIQQMQNDIDLVKKTQEKILELLQSK